MKGLFNNDNQNQLFQNQNQNEGNIQNQFPFNNSKLKSINF